MYCKLKKKKLYYTQKKKQNIELLKRLRKNSN